MADTLTAPASGRATLRASAQSLISPSWLEKPVSEYAPAFRRRLAGLRSSKALRRAELRAKAFELVAADRKGGAA